MKKFFALFVAVAFTASTVNAGMIYIPVETKTSNTETKTPSDVFSKMDTKTFLSLTPAKIQELTGTKMSFKEKIALKLVQRDVRKQLKQGKEVNMAEMSKRASGSISALWLILGLLLGLIGVLIALLTKKGKDDNRVKSSLIGWGIWIAIVLIIYVL